MTSSSLEALQIQSGAFCGADLEKGIAAISSSVEARRLVPVFGAGVSAEAPSALPLAPHIQRLLLKALTTWLPELYGAIEQELERTTLEHLLDQTAQVIHDDALRILVRPEDLTPAQLIAYWNEQAERANMRDNRPIVVENRRRLLDALRQAPVESSRANGWSWSINSNLRHGSCGADPPWAPGFRRHGPRTVSLRQRCVKSAAAVRMLSAKLRTLLGGMDALGEAAGSGWCARAV